MYRGSLLMFLWIYNILLILVSPLVALLTLYNALFKHKRALSTLWRLPKECSKAPSFWIHAVSLGEVNTAKPFIEGLKNRYPQTPIFISTGTETGFSSASCIQGVKPLYLPLDLWFLQNKLIKIINPKLVIFIEGDLWPSLSFLLKKHRVFQVILSAKLSQKSMASFKKWPSIFKVLYEQIDLIGVQDEIMEQRFLSMGLSKERVQQTGNLKLTYSDNNYSESQELIQFLDLDREKKTVLISCTHEGEELLILNLIKPLLPQLNLIIAPRHPQRFKEVIRTLEAAGYQLNVLSHPSCCQGSLYFIDAIGLLNSIYKKVDVTILGGSFVQGVGGHNLMEPIYQGCPVIVGPYAFKQEGLVDLMLKEHLGEVVGSAKLLSIIEQMLETQIYKESIRQFKAKNLNTLQVNLELIEKLVKN